MVDLEWRLLNEKLTLALLLRSDFAQILSNFLKDFLDFSIVCGLNPRLFEFNLRFRFQQQCHSSK